MVVTRIGIWVSCCLFFFGHCSLAEQAGVKSEQGSVNVAWEEKSRALTMPAVGWTELKVLTPRMLELTLISADNAVSSRGLHWDFVKGDGSCRLPSPSSFELVGARGCQVTNVGFKRRVLYAPLKKRDLRIANWLYLELSAPLPEGALVEVINPDRKLWSASTHFEATNTPGRLSPVIHVNQTGYEPGWPKHAMIGYYVGSLGELQLASSEKSEEGVRFQVLDTSSDKTAFEGLAKKRSDQGFPFLCYQQVFDADFSPLKTSGHFRLVVPGLGTSFEFVIEDSISGTFARANALGLYHQRCGTANELPYTRFVHGPCHIAPAEIPDDGYRSAVESLAKESANYKDNPRHTAPQLKSFSASLYPFARKGTVEVRGGHHDAGDYSKYTINSAAFIHYLVFAADVFPGVGKLDNLGLPESGDGKSDVLQEAKWEADFLQKMQDEDGGFYFLVYPRDREYETEVLPDKGDPQLVFPKNTSATAAAVAALAQCASSPLFKEQFPEAAASCLEHARKGWAFLERAIDKYGKDGAYQKITHYGDLFMHDDELAWAACEMFLATRDAKYHQSLIQWLDPSDPATKRWGWWRLSESYGCAMRSYAFGVRSRRVKPEELNPLLLEACENEIAAAGEDQLKRANQSAYGTSFPEETKRTLSAGWYFSSDAAFDLAVACQLPFPEKRDPRLRMREAILSNLNYEQGCNPVNVAYLTGLGWKRQREIVHQYAQNDRRVLPPSGIPLGNVQGGFGWNFVYSSELDKLAFPLDGGPQDPYPFYDRWGDGFNLSQEFVILNQARALGYTCWLFAERKAAKDAWKTAPAKLIRKESGFELSCPGLDLTNALVTWESSAAIVQYGGASWKPIGGIPNWVEAEALLPDGRRVCANWDSSSR